jgi:hypothetical protein
VIKRYDPISAWEWMVTELVRTQNGAIAASKAESMLRKTVKEIIDAERGNLRKQSRCPILLSQIKKFVVGGAGGHLVSLNFEDLAYGHLDHVVWRDRSAHERLKRKGGGGARKLDLRLLLSRVVVNRGLNVTPSLIWHPHGHYGAKESLRLGQRDYGFLPPLYAEAFRFYKKWEASCLGGARNRDQPLTDHEYKRLLSCLEELDRRVSWDGTLSDSWVTRFMLLPVTFIGVGLSASEWGMRWLLVQRARNLARVAAGASLPLLYTVQDIAPFGVKTRHFPNWDAAWKEALEV